jgi:hypothetical protein
MPLLTLQEEELLKQFGWGSHKTIRWPDSNIEVFDTTNFYKMQEILDEWNQVTGAKMNFYLSDNPHSPVKISYDHQLREQNLCGHIDTHWRNYQLNKAEITINPDFSFCGYPEENYGLYLHLFTHWRNYQLNKAEITINPDFSFCGYPEENYGLYLHLFAGVVGFDAWKGTTVDRKEWKEFTLIPDIMQRMIKALYRVSPGYELNTK